MVASEKTISQNSTGFRYHHLCCAALLFPHTSITFRADELLALLPSTHQTADPTPLSLRSYVSILYVQHAGSSTGETASSLTFPNCESKLIRTTNQRSFSLAWTGRWEVQSDEKHHLQVRRTSPLIAVVPTSNLKPNPRSHLALQYHKLTTHTRLSFPIKLDAYLWLLAVFYSMNKEYALPPPQDHSPCTLKQCYAA